MRNRKQTAAVLIVAVILGIVGCKNQSNTEIGKDDIEITTTTTAVETKETTSNPETSITTESEMTVEKELEETSAPEEPVTESTSETTEPSKETEPVQTDPTPTSTPKATATPTPEQKATETPTPTETPRPMDTPTPTATPVPTNTPSPEPTPFDIDKSAKENGYEIIDIDMGDGKTERIYGYYVDMSGLATKINDYRESLGLSRLPTDTGCVSEMKTRVAEATVKYSHWRPNGQGGQETNLAGSITPSEAYQDLYNSDSHRSSWEDIYSTSIYCVGFRRMVYREDKNEWSGSGSATVVYFGDNLS